jgi:hypothetical protein
MITPTHHASFWEIDGFGGILIRAEFSDYMGHRLSLR